MWQSNKRGSKDPPKSRKETNKRASQETTQQPPPRNGEAPLPSNQEPGVKRKLVHKIYEYGRRTTVAAGGRSAVTSEAVMTPNEHEQQPPNQGRGRGPGGEDEPGGTDASSAGR